MVRYLANGGLDASFSGDGKAFVDFVGGTDSANAIVLRPDGKIVLGGYAQVAPCDAWGVCKYGFALAQFLANGNPDTTFGNSNGRIYYTPPSTAAAYAMTRQADGKLVLAGHTANADITVARFNPNGALDTTFSGGVVRVNYGSGTTNRAYAVKVQTDGKIIAAGDVIASSDSAFSVVRFLAK